MTDNDEIAMWQRKKTNGRTKACKETHRNTMDQKNEKKAKKETKWMDRGKMSGIPAQHSPPEELSIHTNIPKIREHLTGTSDSHTVHFMVIIIIMMIAK